jgi:hypothetical protein
MREVGKKMTAAPLRQLAVVRGCATGDCPLSVTIAPLLHGWRGPTRL